MSFRSKVVLGAASAAAVPVSVQVADVYPVKLRLHEWDLLRLDSVWIEP